VSSPQPPFWAKLQPGTDTYHPVLYHLVDVAQVCRFLWDEVLRGPVKRRMSEALTLDAEVAGGWVAFWVGAHDIGKVSPGFQAKNDAFKRRLLDLGYGFPPSASPAPHGTVSTAVLREALARPAGWPAVDAGLAKRVAVAVGGHHGVFPRAEETSRLGRKDLGDSKWGSARSALLAELAAIFGLNALPAPLRVVLNALRHH
jgi:CRISPR-associated endonuclease/helicase Cas3